MPIALDGPFGALAGLEADFAWRRQLAAAGLSSRARCVDVCQTVHAGRPCLAYVVGGEVVLGGPPAPAARLAADDVPPVPAPSALARVLAVHDGWGPADGPRAAWWRAAFLPAAQTSRLTRHVRFGLDTILYDPAAYVRFSTDGVGGGWCVHVDGEVHAWSATTQALGPAVGWEVAARAITIGWSAHVDVA